MGVTRRWAVREGLPLATPPQGPAPHPLLARLWGARGVTDAQHMDPSLSHMPSPLLLKGMAEAAASLAQAIASQARLVIVADYDCDGATACAVGLRGLRRLGALHVDFVVPDRAQDGYGLTPPIADRVHALGADWLITVDNGIASVEGVAHARALGLKVLITDHHLPGQALPEPEHLINPNQPGCHYPSKHLSGVGVMFQLLLATRAAMRAQGAFAADAEPRLDDLLPLVALGTVADVVPLDEHNRRWVQQGLARMRRGRLPPGLQALFEVSGRMASTASAADLGFALGPRINAAGRLADMRMGIQCLVTDDAQQARHLAQQLDDINRQRRELETDMHASALALAQASLGDASAPALCVFDPSFHEGVVGIVASRLKEAWHRPTFVLAANAQHPEWLRGSGRSIPGFHLRDALDLISKRHPGLMQRFGGHAMAAGCTLHRDGLATFAHSLAEVASETLAPEDLQQVLRHDGPLAPEWLTVDTAELLRQQVWGQGFAEPLFCNPVRVVQQRRVGERHLKLQLDVHGQRVAGIWFGRAEPLPPECELLFALESNTWQGQTEVQLRVVDARF